MISNSMSISSFNHPKPLQLILIQEVRAPYFQQKIILGPCKQWMTT